MNWWGVTGNEIFDFYFGMVTFFAFSGWVAGVLRGLVGRLIR